MKEKLEHFFITWGVILVLNQLLIFGGCFTFHCLLAALPHTGVIAFFLSAFILRHDKKIKRESPKTNLQSNTQAKPKQTVRETYKYYTADPLKMKGDEYERHIGKRFEEKKDLVIYNGFIRGYEDGGVDLVAIPPDSNTINLIQCKHWSKKTIELFHIEQIYSKLNNHNFDFLDLSESQINAHLSVAKEKTAINNILSTVRMNQKMLTIRKTLYISSDHVVDLEIGKHLTMIKPNIFRYEDMKIVVEKISS